MKVLMILAILGTFGMIGVQYSRSKDIKKLLVALATFAVIVALGVVGNITRAVVPLFIAHIILIFCAWGGLLLYMIKDRYYWWVIFSPVVTIGVFLLLELITGSGHEFP